QIMADIFISYSSYDRDKALSLAEELRSLGTSVWMDQAIDGAARWSEEIAQALDECKALILLVSKSSLASKNCVKEVTIAAESDKHILPIDLENIALPREFKYHLAGIQRVAYSNTDAIRRAIENLIPVNSVETRHGASLRSHDSVIRLAVLPFDDLSPKKDNAWFADGMMDELIGTLSAIQKLRVASRSEVTYYKKHRPKAKKIADDLKVRYLIEGSVRKAGEKIRITVSLSDMAFGEQLWMNNYDGTFDDVFDFQETVSKKIAEALELKLTPQEEKIIRQQPTENTEAYELYLKGLEFHRLLTRDGYEKALTLYEAAVALDPKYVDAYLNIANVCCVYYRECSRDPKWLTRAENNLKNAEGIVGETARTLWIKGEISWQKNNYDEAELLLLHAIELDPKFPAPFNILGNIYMKIDKKTKAVWAFEKVVSIINNHQAYSNLIIALASVGNFPRLQETAESSLPIMKKHLAQYPDDLAARVGYAETLLWANRKQEAMEEANALANRNDLDGMMVFNLGAVFGHLGFQNKYVEMLRLSVEKGFREIEAFKEQLDKNNPRIQKEIQEIIYSLESILEIERTRKADLLK
ncbi:MAG: TIR domain-containing protein, partial [Candidatus Kapaibacterium sp.]